MQTILSWLAGGIGVIFFLGFAIFQAIVGYLGIEYHLGQGWAIGFLIAAFIFRFSLPLTIGTFFGAVDVLGWNIFVAILITAPGLIFMVPGAIAMALAGVASTFSGKSEQNYQPSYKYDEPKNVTPLKAKPLRKKVPTKKTKKLKKVLKRKKNK
tara:strand:- start:71 stop:532 length:462 start_codon:yes stop_codon:yes gene_type:complete